MPMNRREFVKRTYTYPAALSSIAALPSWKTLLAAPIYTLDPNAPTDFILDTHLDHPFFFWPLSLLTYDIEANGADLIQLHLLCVETGEDTPFQISKSPTTPTKLRFLTDLPASQRRTFRLQKSPGKPPATTHKLTITQEPTAILLDSGPLQIRIPKSQPVSSQAPGPILQLRRAAKWSGASTLTFPSHPVTSLHTDQIESGPLYAAYRLTYTLAGGAQYIATVEIMAGVDFIRLREDMHSLPAESGGAFDLTWTGIPFTHRQMPDHPYPFPPKVDPTHRFEDYAWETIDQPQINTHIGVLPGMASPTELAYSLGVFQPWPVWTVGTYATFWDQASNDAASIFIDRVDLWRDPDYPIWHPSPRLRVLFFYKERSLTWHFPLERGSRSTCLTFHDHAKDKEHMALAESYAKGVPSREGHRYSTALYPSTYGQFLQNKYGTLELDRVKDWALTYPADAPTPKPIFPPGRIASAAATYSLTYNSMLNTLGSSGTRQNSGFGPTNSRTFLDQWIDAIVRFWPSLTPPQKERLAATCLLLAYAHAGEDYMPMIPMLSGHPNFLSDVKSTPAAFAFCFPQHPAARVWVEEFEKFLVLNTHYHTRPTVETYASQGGRWTENLGTYVWAFLRPSLRAAWLVQQITGQQPFTTPQIALLGDWLVNSLTAPFAGERKDFIASINLDRDAHFWGLVMPGSEPRRIFPPLGAHAERRKTPRAMWYLGTCLQHYAPLTAEHLLWAARPDDQDVETFRGRPDSWEVMYQLPDNRGTNPHLRSSKYTGFGITLRTAVGTPKEISVHLQQIDDGPNYRWGVPGEGGCGLLYFFAGGKGYSHNGVEDEGDRFAQDTDFGTNFGVWKEGRFRSIGQNVLSRPLYDLDTTQFAELVPRTGLQSYSLPEYVSRSVMVAGSEYFMLYDQVFNESIGHRLSWFVRKGDDFPHITLIRGLNKDTYKTSTVATSETEGRWYDGTGDSLACVTHLVNITPTITPYGAIVQTPTSQDHVFFDPHGVHFQEADLTFEGTAGLVRSNQSGTIELSLFHGTHIAAKGIAFRTQDTDLGLIATLAPNQPIRGKFVAPQTAAVEIDYTGPAKLYLNGEPAPATRTGDTVKLTIPKGTHIWELTTTQPTPPPPRIYFTENHSGGARIFGLPVAGAASYRLELSTDNAVTWKPVITSNTPTVELANQPDGQKVHVRLVALNPSAQESQPGLEYPIYVTSQPPLPPDGLVARLREGSATLSWGEVLGVSAYRLYRKSPGQPNFVKIYEGRIIRTYTDHDAQIHPADNAPETRSSKSIPILEYAVASVNGNGEGPKSRPVNTDPTSWRNFDPIGGELFRRPIVAGRFGLGTNDGGGDYYPA
jgi:hypothetical protein